VRLGIVAPLGAPGLGNLEIIIEEAETVQLKINTVWARVLYPDIYVCNAYIVHVIDRVMF
jgi:uncharacterized surface protein with fasciclin (FAS1) repeats